MRKRESKNDLKDFGLSKLKGQLSLIEKRKADSIECLSENNKSSC